jgi:hypothetical protein
MGSTSGVTSHWGPVEEEASGVEYEDSTVLNFVYQYSETNVMHFLFNLLRIQGLYLFRTLLAHSQEALHKRHLVYCVRVMSVGCYQCWSGSGRSN